MPTFSLFYLEPARPSQSVEGAGSCTAQSDEHVHAVESRTRANWTIRSLRGRAICPMSRCDGWRRASARKPICQPCDCGGSIRPFSPLIRIISPHRERRLWVRCPVYRCIQRSKCWCASASRRAKRSPQLPIITRIQFGWNELGQIAPGRRADILVLDGDPTNNIWNVRRISTLIFDGNIVDRDGLLKRK